MRNKIKPVQKLDAVDRRLLREMQINNMRPLHELADVVHLSPPAIARRLQRLRSSGIIQRDVSILDPVRVGRGLTIIVEVYMTSERSAELDAIRARFRECPAVQQCFYVTGEADFILVLNVSGMEEYEALTRKLFFDSGIVQRFRTSVAMECVKTGTLIDVSSEVSDS
jgi:Lrp/AsnC family transcriptional regulator, leucine-responsive regulatory protein